VQFLGEREHGVHHDDHDDRDRHGDDAGQPREQRCGPQQQGEGVGELVGELPPPPAPAPAHQAVAAMGEQPALRLPGGQTLRCGPQVPEQAGDRLGEVDRRVLRIGQVRRELVDALGIGHAQAPFSR
jgi:hypothetical protein